MPDTSHVVPSRQTVVSPTTTTAALSPGVHMLSKPEAPFGTLLGRTPAHNVAVYSCNYNTLPEPKFGNITDFEHNVNGEYTGFKWQCVELGRRYWLESRGVVFDSIPMAYDIFRLKYVRDVQQNVVWRLKQCVNGGETIPAEGDLVIWDEGGFFERTGHVAVVVGCTDEYVDIAEQNVEDALWPEDQKYSRRLKLTSSKGRYTLSCTYGDTKILGWMRVTKELFNYDDHIVTANLSTMQRLEWTLPKDASTITYLDENLEASKLFIAKYGPNIAAPADTTAPYYTLTKAGEQGLQAATDELHTLFLDATDYVLHHSHTAIGKAFQFPEAMWRKIRRSWWQRRRDIVAGRFDFALTNDGVKVYEYNADSASCLFECGNVQDRWCKAAGMKVGTDTAGGKLFEHLVETWKRREVEGVLHLMCDDETEEKYHAAYMKSAAEKAGIECRMIVGVSELSFTPDGNITDAKGLVLKNVWKTWSWRTALNELSDQDMIAFLDNQDEFEKEQKKMTFSGKPRLVDVLLHFNIRVFEPLWTIIPSSKAILPVLWQLKPNHPYLLKSHFDLTPELRASGHVAKPVTGRAGGNVRLFAPNGSLIEETKGKWGDDRYIYQELCTIPKYRDHHVQVCTWAIDGTYGGTVLRVDSKNIIDYESGVYPIRIVEN
jgi:glutathionylspermidine amidase/synthetase